MKDYKHVYRSKDDKIVAGVCGGLAQHFNIDPIWLRLAAVLLVLADGVGIILYIIAWILIPENPNQKSKKKTVAEETVSKISKNKGDGSVMLGMVIVLVGATLLLKNLFSWINFKIIWPLGLVALGVYLMTQRNKK